jgi:formylglycine-generating enzyme required for sulfatase activity
MEQSTISLLQELVNETTTDQRRQHIGEWLAKIGDPRPGVGVRDGIPDFVWLPVTPGGVVEVTRVWEAETPEEESRITYRQSLSVKPFYISKYLVTYAQYHAFVEADGGFHNITWWQDMPSCFQPQELSEQKTKFSNNPRDNISWYQSVAFARWVNHRLGGFELPALPGNNVLRVGQNAQVRLPTEWEWQWAAQNGAEERLYPWGERKLGFANTADTGLKQAIAVGMYPHGAAACGALDMTGNIMEWCGNDKKAIEIVDVGSNSSKVLRGGDWGYGIEIASCTRADDEDPGRMDILNGFRLAVGLSTPSIRM